MFIWTFLLRITHTIISQSIADSSWTTLYLSVHQVIHCLHITYRLFMMTLKQACNRYSSLLSSTTLSFVLAVVYNTVITTVISRAFLCILPLSLQFFWYSCVPLHTALVTFSLCLAYMCDTGGPLLQNAVEVSSYFTHVASRRGLFRPFKRHLRFYSYTWWFPSMLRNVS